MSFYHGGKKRIGKRLAKEIVNIGLDIAEEEEIEIKGYCEPFCGMLGVYRHIPKMMKENGLNNLTYKAGDLNKSVIMMWKAAQKGWVPPEQTSEREYNKLRYSKDSALRGYIGHQFSFGGQYFKGFIGRYGKKTSNKTAPKNIKEIATELKNVQFSYGSYTQFSNLKGYIIYCDPPYKGTECRYVGKFDHIAFWNWVRDMSEYNIVFVSEYQAPSDMETVYITSRISNVSGKHKKNVDEKLFYGGC